MVLESTVICVDNSEWMRNGDFLPSRIQAQQDAVSIICHAKTRQNPENNVALLTLASLEVLTTLTTDVGKILTKLHQVQPDGDMRLLTGIRIAHLALKHRQGKNHKMRIVAFVGSPVDIGDKELVKVAKKLKKEKVAVDVICLGEDSSSNEKLSEFVNTLNGKDGSGSHLVTVPAGQTLLAEAIRSSPVVQGEDGFAPVGGFGSGFDDVDANLDPELALALRVSMEEQRQRQDEEARKVTEESSKEETTPKPSSGEPTASVTTNEDTLLQRALAMSMGGGSMDFNALSEDEQMAMAIQMSMADSGMTDESDASRPGTNISENPSLADTPTAMETDSLKEGDGAAVDDQQDYSAVMNDPAFLQHLVSSLPGVDPNSEAIRDALGALTQQGSDENQDKDKQKKEDKS